MPEATTITLDWRAERASMIAQNRRLLSENAVLKQRVRDLEAALRQPKHQVGQ
jgi:hypothetical protein